MLGPLVLWRSSCSNSQYLIKTEEARKSLLFYAKLRQGPETTPHFRIPGPAADSPCIASFET
jgi:hypothetical protein